MSTPPYSQQSHSIHQPPNPQTDKLCEHTPTNKDNTPASHSILRSERLQPIQQTPNPHQQTDIYEHNTKIRVPTYQFINLLCNLKAVQIYCRTFWGLYVHFGFLKPRSVNNLSQILYWSVPIIMMLNYDNSM